MSLSTFFRDAAQRRFAFLVTDFGFQGPTIKELGWHSTTLHYLKGSISVTVNLDMEEAVLVTIELWAGPAKAEYPPSERRRFSPTSLARFRDPDWPLVVPQVPITEPQLLDDLEREAQALQAHARDVLMGETGGLRPFLAALDEWHERRRDSPFPPR